MLGFTLILSCQIIHKSYETTFFDGLSIAEYFYKLCLFLMSPWGESKYKQRVEILSDTAHQNV